MELCKEYKSMNCNEKTEQIRESFDVDYQLNLPQYLEDIEKLIKCCVKNVVCDYEFTGSGIKIFGKSIISILYLDSEGCPLSCEFEEEFDKSFDLSDCEYFYFANVDVKTKYYNHRLINQRRIDVHSSLGVCIDVYCKNPCKCLSSCKDAFVREMNISSLTDKNAGICSAEFDETFPIVKNEYQIKNIINAFVTSIVEDKKIIKDKMLVKIRNEITVVYVNENNSLEKCLHTFSVSKIIDTAECDENDTAFISSKVSQLYVKAKSDSNNLLNDIEAVGKISISYKINAISEMSFVSDSYIPHHNASVESKNIQLKSNPVFYFDDKTYEISIDCDKNVIEIVDLKVDFNSFRVEKSVMYIETVVCAVYYDDSSQLCYLEKSSEFSFTLNDKEFEGEGIANLQSYDYVIKSADKISLRLNFEYSAYLYRNDTVRYLTDIEDDGEKTSLNTPELTLYFANKNENVWDIAKSFSTAMQLIMEENDLKSEIIDDRRVLLVPGM
ncbi:MAG: DUF3794 domain-containing protein [Eubacterium sp.]